MRYQTCLFCKQPLGRNATLEAMPVGQRLAFDAHRGRLWVVCHLCGGWNLTPLEDRWEAVEVCERLYRGTRLRYATENLGLARLPSGLELIRVGQPLFPEFAAWRYGRRLSWLRRAWRGQSFAWLAGERPVLYLVPDAPHALRVVPVSDVPLIRLNPPRDDRPWSFERPLARMDADLLGRWTSLHAPIPLGQEFTGPDGLRFGAGLFSVVNRQLPVRRLLPAALAWLGRQGNPFAGEEGRTLAAFRYPEVVADLNPVVRFALEIATHEEEEVRFLRAELGVLESAWRKAEEIASIADALTRPAWIERWIAARRSPLPLP